MRLDARAFGLAAGAAAAVLFLICAVAVAIAPEATTAIAGELIHADLSGMTRTLTLGSFIGGLLGWLVGTAVTFWFIAWIYNQLAGRTANVRVSEPHAAAP
jgi:membrane protein YqaA with SNARE-associated domain